MVMLPGPALALRRDISRPLCSVRQGGARDRGDTYSRLTIKCRLRVLYQKSGSPLKEGHVHVSLGALLWVVSNPTTDLLQFA